MPFALLAFVFALPVMPARAEPQLRLVEPQPPGNNYEWIAQDADGVIWLAGQQLVSFDGVRYQTYDIPGEMSVSDSPDGYVYVSGVGGVWRARDRRVEKLDSVQAIFAVGVPGGALLAHHDSVLLWRPGRGIVSRYKVPSGTVTVLIPDSHGNYLMPVRAVIAQLRATDLAADKLSPISIPETGNPEGNNWLWAGYDSRGVLWMRSQLAIARLVPGGSSPEIVNRRRTDFWRAAQSRSGEMLFPRAQGPTDEVLAIADRGTLRLTPWQGQAATRGHDGTLWVWGPGGLSYLPLAGRIRTFPSGTGSPSEIGMQPLRISYGLHLPATRGIYRLDEDQLRFRLVSAFDDALPLTNATTYHDRLVLTRMDGFLTEWTPRGLRFPPAPERPEGPSGAVHATLDRQGRLWTAYRDALVRVDNDLRAVESIVVPGRSRPVDFIFDPLGRIWAALRIGLGLYQNGSWRLFTREDGLRFTAARTLAWHENALWLGYADNNDEFTRLSPSGTGWNVENLSASTGHGAAGGTRFLRTDERGWLWRGMITGGVSVCATNCRDGSQWISFRPVDGLAGVETRQNAWSEDTLRKHAWLPTAGGLSRYEVEPDLFTRQPDLQLTIAPPQQKGNEWSFQWGSTWYHHRSAIQIRYRLKGHDKNWTYVIQPSPAKWEVTYGKLGWGDYGFEVQGRAGRGEWHPSVARANLHVAFPYTPHLGVTGGLLALATAAFALHERRRRAAREQFAQLKHAVAGAIRLSAADREAYLAGLPAPLAEEARRTLLYAEAPLPTVLPAEAPRDHSGLLLAARYLLEQQIAAGGFATLYRASDIRMNGRPTAIKLLHRGDGEAALASLGRELEALARLRHSGVVGVFDSGVTPWNQPFLALEFIHGHSLRERLSARIPRREAVHWMRELAETLDVVHHNGIVHRDLKPENLMLRSSPSDGESRMVVIDLGIASIRHHNQNSVWATQAAGSLDYMAPEQIYGLASPAADVYSFAMIATECLCGTSVAPFAAAENCTVAEAAALLLQRNALEKAVPAFKAALSYSPEIRHRSATAFWHEVESVLHA